MNLLPRSIVAAWSVLIVVPAFAAPPNIDRLTPPALIPGKPARIVIDGNGLAGESRLIASVKFAESKIIRQTATQTEWEVTVDSAATAGIYPLRCAGPDGISNALPFAVDAVATTAFIPKIESLPIALAGNLAGPQVLTTTFSGSKDQTIVLDVEAQRLGSNLRPVVRLYDPRGRQIAWSPPRYQAGGDARCEAKLPADGTYSIELHDQLYRANDPAPFRLKIGDLQYAEQTFPLAIKVGEKSNVKLLLSNVSGQAEAASSAGDVPGVISLPWPKSSLPTGGAPRIILSDIPEFTENFAANTALPAAVSGILDVSGKEQTHAINVAPGTKVRIDVGGRRFGSPIDAVLTVRNDKGAQLATADDRPGSSDPMVEVAVPNDMNKLVIAVKDMQDRGGPDYFYRVEVRDAVQPDFNVSVSVDRINIPAGGTVILPLQLTRTNYDGPLTIEAVGLPPELKVDGLAIPPGTVQALLSFSAPANFKFAGTFALNARGGDAAAPIVRRVLFSDSAAAKYQPWFRYEAGAAVAAPSPLQFVWQTPTDERLLVGGKLSAVAQVQRTPGATGPIRLRLMSTQPMPRKKIRENNQDKEVDDLARALRIDGAATIAADKTETPLDILIPGDLPLKDWSLAVVAELLSADGKTVVAAAPSAVRRFNAVAPFALELAADAQGPGRTGTGDAAVLRGKLSRVAGFQQPLVVTLVGLPKEIHAPLVVVPADKTEFELPLRFPFGTAVGEQKGVKLVAVLDPTSSAPARSAEIPVTVNIVAGEQPPAEPPQPVFDENAEFITQLTEGPGQATVESVERYSGKIAVKVTPQQKFNANLPGLSVKIREKPGPGEYRYLRFAWKKKDGNTIVLQLNHDGAFGPGGSGRPGAKFRYHAGTNGEQFGGSVEVDNKLPADFVVVTRDLFADFGEFTLNGVSLAPVDGAYGVFDHIYLARSIDDLALAKKEKE